MAADIVALLGSIGSVRGTLAVGVAAARSGRGLGLVLGLGLGSGTASSAAIAAWFVGVPDLTQDPSARSVRPGESTMLPRDNGPLTSTFRVPRTPTVTGTRSIWPSRTTCTALLTTASMGT